MSPGTSQHSIVKPPRGWPRVVIYSHDTFGLGHLTRSTRIARGVLSAFPGGSVLLLSGSPIAHRFSFPARVDYVKLPSVVKSGPDSYDARELRISPRRICWMRAQLILDTIDSFRPHLLLVDNVPLGMKGELVPALEWLKRRLPRTRIHLDLRDVLDDPQVIRESWTTLGVPRILNDIYDEIHVFGHPTIFDAISAYGLPVEKSSYLNYLAPSEEERISPAPLPPLRPGRARILVTVGGGGDGASILHCVAALQRKLGKDSPYHFDLVTGPLMPVAARLELLVDLDGLPGIVVHEYVEHLPAWMSACDLLLCMGGYNTLCEAMAVAPRAVVVPRIHPRREQEIRARALEERGLIEVIHPEKLDPTVLEQTLHRSLQGAPVLRTRELPPLTGAAELAGRLVSVLTPPKPRSRGNRNRSAATVSERAPGTRRTAADERGLSTIMRQRRSPRLSAWRHRGVPHAFE